MSIEQQSKMAAYPTLNTWKLTYHACDNKKWRLEDYIEKCKITSMKQFWQVHNNLDKIGNLIDHDYFLMKNDINPIWEDKMNRNGIVISIRVPGKIVNEAWTLLLAMIIGETFSVDNYVINGVSIKYVRATNTRESSRLKDKTPITKCALIKIWTRKYTKNIQSSINNYIKVIIPKYIDKKYKDYKFTTQETIMKPQY
jgi:Eukaryotic initiation factor 4E